MAQYRVRHRSGRPHLQKAQIRTLTQGSDPHDAAKLDNEPNSEKQSRNSSNTVHMTMKRYTTKLENVHRLDRNALQREKRAKAKWLRALFTSIFGTRQRTYEWSQQTLTSSDDTFIRREARDIAASGNNQNIREATNAALEVRAAHKMSRQAKSNVRKLATKEKLDQVEFLMGASYETLYEMRVKELDLQIDQLRGIKGSHIPAKSTLRTKEAKIKAILAEFQLRNKSKLQGGEASFMIEGTSSRNRDTDTIFEEKDGYPEDEDMYFDNEIMIQLWNSGLL
ncbi:hypothetical protein FRC07_009800 [Ceratobasidium sp. 392]|nr:hypothetical protein FRC07_009800 [Ceratobasidium sp. 392]